MASLGSLVEVNPRGSRPDGPVSLISIADIDTLTATATPQLMSHAEEAGSARRVAREGDVVFARISPSMENGKVAIVPKLASDVTLVSGELFVLRPEPQVDPRMIWAFLRQQPLLRQLQTFMAGSSGYQRLDREILEQIELPPLSDRQWPFASAALEQLDRAAEIRRATTETLRLLPGAAIASETASGPFAYLDNFDAELKSGTGERSVDAGAMPMLRNSNLLDGSIDATNLRFMPEKPVEAEQILQPGDLLVVRTSGSAATLARCAVYEDQPAEACFASSLVRIRSNTLSPDFLWAWLQTEMARSACLEQAATTTTRYNLSLTGLRRLPVPILGANPHARLSEFARQTRRMLAASNLHLDLIGAATQAHLAHTFAGTRVSSPQEEVLPQASSLGIPLGLQPVFNAASAAQRRTWLAILRGEGFRVDDLASERERAELQHTLAVLEQIGVLIRERKGVIESWHLPDRETELVG